MKIKCDYCRGYIEDTEEKCPHCGAMNSHLRRTAIETPKTIEELKTWYQEHNLPPEETTRFFIGKDYKSPKAFGIYKEEGTGDFVVYKNKDTGERAVRYKGKDEEYAVNELYMKLKEEIVNQKRNNIGTKSAKKKHGISLVLLIEIIFVVIIFGGILISAFQPKNGYYRYNDRYYYHQGGSWYRYDNRDWDYVSAPEELRDNYSDYYYSYGYSSDYDVDKFEDTSYYETYHSSDDSWDSDSSWDSSDSWDSSSTDWGSDW